MVPATNTGSMSFGLTTIIDPSAYGQSLGRHSEPSSRCLKLVDSGANPKSRSTVGFCNL